MNSKKNLELTLYSTSGCHLCDQAESLLRANGSGTWRTIDIADDDSLLARYGTRIPVLATNDGREINWPFDEAGLRIFMTS